MSNEKKKKRTYPNRNRKKRKNLTGLYAVSYDEAYKDGKLRNEVYGAVDKNGPYVYEPGNPAKDKPRKFLNDMTGRGVPETCKNRILAFWDDKLNKNKRQCYLAEKPLYEEMVNKKKLKSNKSNKEKK